ncbi:MAG: hypothetical protein AAF329_00445 [Cyanobacteria bacterium P01_A01_bin.17]
MDERALLETLLRAPVGQPTQQQVKQPSRKSEWAVFRGGVRLLMLSAGTAFCTFFVRLVPALMPFWVGILVIGLLGAIVWAWKMPGSQSVDLALMTVFVLFGLVLAIWDSKEALSLIGAEVWLGVAVAGAILLVTILGDRKGGRHGSKV